MTNTTQEAVLLTQRKAAAYLGVSVRTMQRLNEAGALTPVRLGGLGHPRYRRADVEAFVNGGSPR